MSSSTFSFASPYATTFSELLSASGDTTVEERSRPSRCYGDRGGGIPKFKSTPPPSLPLSSPRTSYSSYFSIPAGLSPAELLDSPVLLSSNNILPSPTTGTFPSGALNWRESAGSSSFYEGKDDDGGAYSDFSFQAGTKPSSLQQQLEFFKGSQPWNIQEHSLRTESSAVKREDIDINKEQKLSGDGYNWRKYGQKQVKGSENPRSYYKCTYPNCPTKKKVEKTFEGKITEIIYRGTHNHPEPQPTRRNSSPSQSHQPHTASAAPSEASEHSHGGWSEKAMDSVTAPEMSSGSFGEDEVGTSSQRNNQAGDELEEEPQPKRWKTEENEGVSATGSKTVREPRVVVQTMSDIDILDDGYRWRKYGQKVVKGNPNPRSYYKCTTVGCPVRKQIERASNDLRSVITTYEGKHHHDVPAARGSAINRTPQPSGNNAHISAGATTFRPLSAFAPSSLFDQRLMDSQMLSNQGSYNGSSEFENHSNLNSISTSHMNQQQQNLKQIENLFPKVKEEKREDLFLDSFLR